MKSPQSSRAFLAAAVIALTFTTLAGEARAESGSGAEVDLKAPSGSVYTSDGLLGPVRVGPAVAFGVPDGMRLGLFAKWRGLVASGVAFSLVPTVQVPGTEVQLSRTSGEAFLRLHPFRGAFFVGVAGGYGETRGAMSEGTGAPGSENVRIRGRMSAMYVAPQLGFQWMLPFGITVGCDAGAEIPISAGEATFDASRNGVTQQAPATGAVADATRYLATRPLPVVHLLELGFAL